MDNLISSQPAPQAADYEAAIAQILTEIRYSNEQMQSDRAEIDRLRAQTKALKAETRALLADMGASL